MRACKTPLHHGVPLKVAAEPARTLSVPLTCLSEEGMAPMLNRILYVVVAPALLAVTIVGLAPEDGPFAEKLIFVLVTAGVG